MTFKEILTSNFFGDDTLNFFEDDTSNDNSNSTFTKKTKSK